NSPFQDLAISATQKPNSPLQDLASSASPSRKVILVDYPDSEDEDNTCPVTPIENDIFYQIRCCMDFETLQFFVISGAWVGNPAVQKAIQSQYDQLDLDPDGFFKGLFACDEFW
ncbi:MAG: hypothetical protein GY696_03420, partial [Gammaproteobacteria bacterium]|nr:hypothetical protein [Gammaproteobacteria bacterium]